MLNNVVSYVETKLKQGRAVLSPFHVTRRRKGSKNLQILIAPRRDMQRFLDVVATLFPRANYVRKEILRYSMGPRLVCAAISKKVTRCNSARKIFYRSCTALGASVQHSVKYVVPTRKKFFKK